MRRTLGIALGLALGLVLAATLLPAATASAGSYAVSSCRGTKNQRYGTDGWVGIGGGKTTRPTSTCGKGGSLWARVPGNRSYRVGGYVGWAFRAPAGTEIAGYRIYRSARVGPGTATANPVYFLSWPGLGYSQAKDKCVASAKCTAVGDPKKPLAGSNLIKSPKMPAKVRNLSFVAQCGGKAGATCLDATTPPGRDTVRFDVHAAQVTLRDDSAPKAGIPTGPLSQRGTVTGISTLTVPITDVGGGVASVTTVVDGREQGRFPMSAGCSTPYTRVVPCPLATTPTISVDTRALPNNAHTLRVVIRDAAGNRTTPPWELAFSSDNIADSAFDSVLRRNYLIVGSRTKFTRLTATRLPAGSKVQVRCSGGRRRCDGSTRRRTYRDRTTSTKRSVIRAVRGRRLRAGARLRVRVVGADESVRQVSYRIRRGKSPRTSTRCRRGGERTYMDCD